MRMTYLYRVFCVTPKNGSQWATRNGDIHLARQVMFIEDPVTISLSGLSQYPRLEDSVFDYRFGHGCWVGFFRVFALGAKANWCRYMIQFKISYMEFSRSGAKATCWDVEATAGSTTLR